jgi:hypothetical protein
LERRALDGRLSHQFKALLICCAELLVLSALMGKMQATGILRTAFIVLLVLNVIPLGLLFANLQPTHARLYTREQQWRVGVLIFAASPLGLTLLYGSLLFIFGSVIFFYLRVGSSACVCQDTSHFAIGSEAG